LPKPNYIPDPNEAPAKPKLTHEEVQQRGFERILRRKARMNENVKVGAEKFLAKATVGQATAKMEELSTWELKVWVQAEREGQARRGILDRAQFKT
jgi:hypothetical protein